MGTADEFGLRAADLVFDPTLACCKVDVPAPAARGVTARGPYGALVARIPSSPPAPDNRELGRQGLPLSRTMLSNHKLPYVGRFACDWPRLATTDPHAARGHPTAISDRGSAGLRPVPANCGIGIRSPSHSAMSQITKLLQANEGYAAARANVADPRPGRHLAIVTCMDARIDVFAILGLHLGEAHVIRNAGGRVTEDVLRSLALSCQVLGVDTVIVMQHTNCGLAGVTDQDLQKLTGADLGFFPIDDHAAALREDIELLAATSYLAPLKMIAGFVFDVESGQLDDLVRWER